MTTAKKILFITPGAQSFGGNIFLLNFLRWYKRNGAPEFVTLYGYPGDLSNDFDELSRTYQYYFADDKNSFAKAASKLGNQMEVRRTFLKRQIARENIGLIYCNAVTNWRMLSMFQSLDVPVITHCHELESLIQLTGVDNFNRLRDRTSHFVAVSDAVRRNLLDRHAVPDDKIDLIHAFTPVGEMSADEIEERWGAVRDELGLPSDAFIVGASGTLNWRKAPELFVQLASAVKAKRPAAPIYFVWIGGANKGDFRLFELNYDVERLHLSESVRFLEHMQNPLDYFAAIDLFAMVSREDPYPLVCLEAASLGKPIICFADAGGMPEFVGDDCGFVVPYLDLDAFAERVIEMYENSERRKKFGENASQKVRDRHDIQVAAPMVRELIDRFSR